jgi:hypothetical protein
LDEFGYSPEWATNEAYDFVFRDRENSRVDLVIVLDWNGFHQGYRLPVCQLPVPGLALPRIRTEPSTGNRQLATANS